MLEVLAALTPSAGVAWLFWLVIRAIIHADRRERTALAKLDRELAQQTAAAEASAQEVTSDRADNTAVANPW